MMKEKTDCDPEYIKVGRFKDEEIDFETALGVAGFGRYNIYLILACGICIFAVNTNAYSIGYVLPSAECDLKLDTSSKSLLAGIGFIGIISTLYIWGALADTIGRKRVMLISLLGTFITSLGAIFTSTFWIFTTFLFLNGVSISGCSSTVYAYLGEFHTINKRSVAIAWCTVFMSLALAVVPITAWVSISQTFHFEIFNFTFLPWRMYLLLCNLPSIFGAIVIAVFPESPKYLVFKRRIPEAMEILKKMYVVNTKQHVNMFPVKALEKKQTVPSSSVFEVLKNVWMQTISLFQKEHRMNTMITSVLQFGAFGISSGLLIWYPDVLNKLSEGYQRYPNSSLTICEALVLDTAQKENGQCENATVDQTVYLQNFIIGIAYCIGCSGVGFLIDLLGKRFLMVFNLLIPALCCVVLTFVTSNLVVNILFVVVLVPPGLCVAVVTAAVVDVFPTQFKAIAVSLCLLMGRLGSVVATTAIGYLLEFSCNGTFYIWAALNLGCMCLSFFIPDKQRQLNRIA